MDISNFETKVDQKILRRGEVYFNKGYVKNLQEVSKDLWESTIKGSAVYHIETMVGNGLIKHWYCDCPYNGVICKHVVATLFDIREIQNPESEKAIAKKIAKDADQLAKKERLEQLIKTSNREEVLEVLEQFMTEDKASNASKTSNQGKASTKNIVPNSQVNIEKKLTATSFRTSFNAIIKRYSSSGFIDYQASRGFSNDAWKLIKTINSSTIAANVRVDACFKILDSMMKKVVGAIDDSNGDLAELTINLSEVIATAYPELPRIKKERCFEQALFWEFESELGDYGLDQYMDHLAPMWAADNENLQDKYLQAIDGALKGNTDDWKYQSLNEKKFDYLLDWERTEEAERLAFGKMEIVAFREIFVNKAVENEDFKTAKSLIQIGLKLAKEQRHAGTEYDWRRRLIDVARQLNDIDSIRSELLEMQKNSGFEIALYREFKATFTKTEWQAVKGKFRTQILGKLYQAYDVTEIYAEEKELRELFDFIQSQTYEASSLFKHYLKILSKEFPEEASNFYAIIIHHELEQTDRKVYRQAVKDIKVLQKLTMGEAIADQLIREVMIKYSKRPTMLDIFKKAFGDI